MPPLSFINVFSFRASRRSLLWNRDRPEVVIGLYILHILFARSTCTTSVSLGFFLVSGFPILFVIGGQRSRRQRTEEFLSGSGRAFAPVVIGCRRKLTEQHGRRYTRKGSSRVPSGVWGLIRRRRREARHSAVVSLFPGIPPFRCGRCVTHVRLLARLMTMRPWDPESSFIMITGRQRVARP